MPSDTASPYAKGFESRPRPPTASQSYELTEFVTLQCRSQPPNYIVGNGRERWQFGGRKQPRFGVTKLTEQGVKWVAVCVNTLHIEPLVGHAEVFGFNRRVERDGGSNQSVTEQVVANRPTQRMSHSNIEEVDILELVTQIFPPLLDLVFVLLKPSGVLESIERDGHIRIPVEGVGLVRSTHGNKHDELTCRLVVGCPQHHRVRICHHITLLDFG